MIGLEGKHDQLDAKTVYKSAERSDSALLQMARNGARTQILA